MLRNVKQWHWSSWPHEVLLPVLFAGGELAWAYLWLAWLSALPAAGFGRPALSWPAATLLLLLALALARPLLQGDVPDRQAALVMLAGGVVVVWGLTWLEHGRPLPNLTDLAHLPDRV